MIRRNVPRRGLAAILFALAALLWLSAPGVALRAARAEGEPSLLRIDVTARPEGLIEPGDVMLNFTIENVSEEDARNVYLASADGLIFELVGEIAPGETQTFSRQHSVTAEELEAGEILYTVSHDDPVDPNVKINYKVSAPILRSDAEPAVEFTRQFSSRSVEAGGTIAVTYRIQNTGNVPLTELQVQDSLGNYTGRVDALDVGESRTLLSRATIDAPTVSSASLSYRVQDGESVLSAELEDVSINLASSGLDGEFVVDSSAFSSNSANAVLTLYNTGDADLHDLCVIDDLYGGVIADELTLPAGSAPLEISRAYKLREDQGIRWRVTGVSASGERVELLTDTLSLPPRNEGVPGALKLSVQALTPRIRRSGNVTLRVNIENMGGVELRDLTLNEPTLGDLYTFAVLPADGSIQRDFTVYVSDDSSFRLSLRGTDALGAEVAADAPAVEVTIASDGALPEGAQERLFEFSGGSIKIGGSSTFAILLLVGCAVLLTLIVALFVVTRRARMERRLQAAAERQRRREELGKTNRFTPVRAPQRPRGRGRNS